MYYFLFKKVDKIILYEANVEKSRETEQKLQKVFA